MVEPGETFWVRKGRIVLALKSGITLMRTRPELLPRFSTATRTRAARRPLSCRLPRRPACSPPPTCHQLLPRRTADLEPYSPWPGGVCEASSRQFRNRTIPADAAQARRTHRVCQWSSGRRPKTNGSRGFWSGEEQFQRSARLGAGSQHTAAVAGSPVRRLADVRIEDR